MALNKKGQVSIEFILILTIAFVYIGASIWPIATESAQAAFDVKGVGDTKLSALKIANSLNEAASSTGDMKKTISISIPENSMISCDGASNKITYNVRVSNSGGNPDEINCEDSTETVPVFIGGEQPGEKPAWYNCTSSIDLVSGASTDFSITGPIFKEAIVQKINGTITVS